MRRNGNNHELAATSVWWNRFERVFSSTPDLDEFYSSIPIDTWRQILGSQLHYHHGIWAANEDWETALENAVLDLARHVEPGSTVLDLGCGWGGPASVLKERCGCSVLCVTVSQAQASYCAIRGLEVHRADLDSEIPDGTWSVGWWMESLEHLEHPERALGELRRRCKKLVIRVNTCEAGPRRLLRLDADASHHLLP